MTLPATCPHAAVDTEPEPARTAVYPPGPTLPAPLQSALFARRRIGFLTECANRYGDTFTLRIPPWADHMVVVSRPEHFKELFATSPSQTHSGEGNHVIGNLLGRRSILVTDEDVHARLRRLLQPAFSPAAVASYKQVTHALAVEELDRWNGGDIISAWDRMTELSIAVIIRAVFGVADATAAQRLIPLLRHYTEVGPLTLVGLTVDRLQRLGAWKRFRDTESQLNALLYPEIENRRAQAGLAGRDDALSRMLAAATGTTDAPLSDDEVRDQLVTLLLAGHETTAAALAWALYEMACAPMVQASARRAALDGDDDYLEAVLKEAMRRRTSLGGVYRTLNEPLRIAGWDLPKGTVVTGSILLAHQRPDSHPEPERFRPERFLDGSMPANAWVPFGGGVRRCPGAGFTLMEGAVVLREILTRYQLARPAADHDEHSVLRQITYLPARGCRVRITALANPSRPA